MNNEADDLEDSYELVLYSPHCLSADVVARVMEKMRYFTAYDDLKIILNLLQDINEQDVEDRWQCILFHPVICQQIMYQINNLPAAVIEACRRQAPFSDEEETMIASINSRVRGDLQFFAEVLKSRPRLFIFRSARDLMYHWRMMKTNYLLDDQAEKRAQILKAVNDVDKSDLIANDYDQDLVATYEIVQLEFDLMIQAFPEFDKYFECVGVLAILTASNGTQFRMKGPKITIGRNLVSMTGDSTHMDVDLGLMDASKRTSRNQGFIEFDKTQNKFYFCNMGKNSVIIDRTKICKGEKIELVHGSDIMIKNVYLKFTINLYEYLMRERNFASAQDDKYEWENYEDPFSEFSDDGISEGMNGSQ
ncbi:hypothetical protein ACOME3_001991 [Neoechinorhynchus agilis]